MPKLTVIHGTPAPDTQVRLVRERVKAEPKPVALVECHRCGGREFIETKTGLMFDRGKTSGGTKNLICVGCLLNGERVTL